MTKKIINSLIFTFTLINSTILSNGEIKIIGLWGDIKKINPGTELIAFPQGNIISYLETAYPWELTFTLGPYNETETNPIKIYSASFIKDSGEIIHYSIGIQHLNNNLINKNITCNIMILKEDGTAKSIELVLSSERNYEFILDLQGDYLVPRPFSIR